MLACIIRNLFVFPSSPVLSHSSSQDTHCNLNILYYPFEPPWILCAPSSIRRCDKCCNRVQRSFARASARSARRVNSPSVRDLLPAPRRRSQRRQLYGSPTDHLYSTLPDSAPAPHAVSNPPPRLPRTTPTSPSPNACASCLASTAGLRSACISY